MVKTPYERVVTKAQGSRCNICLESGPLTEDHVPPKSCLSHLTVEIEPFEHRLRSDRPRLPWSQSGVRFKTICRRCNSTLGAEYDPALERLCRRARTWLRSPFLLSDRWTVVVDRSRIVRSIFGHLLAASETDADSVQDRAMRAYFRGEIETPSETTRVMYWLHDHPHVAVIKDAAMPSVRGNLRSEVGVFCLLKVPPLAFMVTTLASYDELPRLDVAGSGITPSEVRLWRALAREHDWPERVDEDNFLAVGATAASARTARPLGRRK